ncbi:MAG: S8 family serine peptidase [Gemmatimonadales bacterium]
MRRCAWAARWPRSPRRWLAGIAAGHSLFGVDGFEGVAPGAQILGLKISNNARGSISVTGSMLKAMNYAANFAHQRGLPLVLNLSFGVGNEFEGTAAIDSIVNEFVLRHPDLLFVIAAGNDGPGISTIDFPGSADNALTVCALFPAVFASGANSENDRAEDGVAWWSARGGEVGKPDVCAPGVAYSNVPGWSVGDEISPGTSFAAPQIAGAAALLQSAMLQKGRRVRGIDVVRSLTNSAAPPSHSTRLDAGAGIPNVIGAYRWLLAAHQAGVYSVRALSDGGNSSHGSAAYRRGGLASPADTIQRFIVTSLGGQPAARLKLSSDAAWIATPAVVEPEGEPFTIALTYDATKLSEPGLYVGTVSARPASDTMAGASFTLTNTVVVPRELSRKFVHADSLNAGWVQRYFFTVPQDAGGLSVRFRGQGVAAGGTLYLFEPDGQPYRGRSSAEIDALDRSATIEVAAQDLRAGVYEAVVVAPPGGALEYSLEAAIPDVNVSAIDDGPVATVRNPGAQHVEVVVAAEAVGATRAMRLSGRRSDPAFERVTAPDWADRLVVDVTLDEEYWSRVTDFGVTVFDSTGAKLADGPLNYSFGRLTLPLDSLGYKGNMSIELIPAYAHLEPPAEWEADVRISFMPPAAIPFIFADSSREFAISLAPGSAEAVSATGSVGVVAIPDGFTPLVQVRAETPGGPVAIRRQAVGLTSDSTFTTRPREERTKR